jgi:hypothetical protein
MPQGMSQGMLRLPASIRSIQAGQPGPGGRFAAGCAIPGIGAMVRIACGCTGTEIASHLPGDRPVTEASLNEGLQ